MLASRPLLWRALALVLLAGCSCARAPIDHSTALVAGAAIGHVRLAETTTTTSPPPPPPAAVAPHPAPGHAVRSGPRPTVPPAPRAPRSFEASVERWRPLVASVGAWPVDEVLSVMTCESHGNPAGVGPRYVDRKGGVHYPHGLLQVMDGPFDPEANLRVAFSIWSGSRWRQWSCKPG